MKKKLLILTLLLSCFYSITMAQSGSVSGRVLAADDGNALAGVTINEIGTSNTVSTDGNGSFTIKVKSNSKLRVSYLGYDAQIISVPEKSPISIKLVPSNNQLNDVVVTAYGSTKKSAFTGTASTISNEKFKDLQATTITGVLQGNASGVLAVTSSGQPGENPTIRIRGIGSVNASNDPLILLDGTPYSGNINSINPSEIESVTVLKDASSTSIYGSRAANGILQIITKKGNGKPKVQFSSVTGFSKRAVAEYKTVNEGQYLELYWEALKNDAMANPALLTQFNQPSAQAYASTQLIPRTIYNPYNVAQPVGLDGKIAANAKLLWSDNWIDAVTRTGVRSDNNLNISGSDAANTVRYFLSGGVLKEQGVLEESEFNRYTGRAKVDVTPVKWLRAGVNSSLTASDQNYPYQGNGGGSSQLSFARGIAPIYPIYLRDATTGDFIYNASGNKVFDFGNNTEVLGTNRSSALDRPYIVGQNPVGTTRINPITNGIVTVNANVYAEADLYEGLTFKSQYSVNFNQGTNSLFWNPFYGDGTTSGGYSYRSIANLTAQNFSNTLNYDKTLGLHHFNILAGTEAYKETVVYTTASSTGFTFAQPTEPSYGSVFSGSGTKTYFNLESYFGRASYDVADRYHLSLSLRTDGSTRFAEANRWGVFYAIGTSWNVDKENFMKNVAFLSSLKLKGSYGTSGNQSLPGDFPYLGTYNSGQSIAGAAGATINTLSNFDLTWEKQKQLDLGVEFGVLKDRITGSVVYFDRRSSNLLFQRPLPNSTGINSISDNVGGVRNYGLEVELNTVNIKRNNFNWRTSFNITRLHNKISAVAPGTTQVLGRSLYDWSLREYAGVNPTNGMPQWYMDDAANPGKKITTEVYSQATLYYTGFGSRLSDYTGGITNFLNYKAFDLTILASFGIGGKMYDSDYASLMGGVIGSSNLSRDIYNRWQSAEAPGNGTIPRLTTVNSNPGTSSSTRFLYNASFARIRNITLGYRLPETLLKRVALSNVRVFADLQNPLTFFGGPKGTDPEAGLNAQTGSSNTTSYKTFAIGLNVAF